MATAPYFILSPSTILSIVGFLRGPDPTVPTPPEDWRTAKVDVIIPALNEEAHIAFCLAGLLRQTLRPRRVMLIDDGSTDQTVEVAEAFCSAHGVDLITIRRRVPIGKTPTIKRQARELDSDVEFILDADTVLESPNYLERTVQELYQAVGIASACGVILPLRKRDRKACTENPDFRAFVKKFPQHRPPVQGWRHDLAAGVTNLYRDVLYQFLQRFVYRGQMVFFGTITNPVGCAVAYRRKYVQRLFDEFSPLLGDDLTNSEDIFIGMAMLDDGYRNVQLTDVCARTVEPEVQRLYKQVYLWSSAFLQSCYYFDELVKGPFKALKRSWSRWRGRSRTARPWPSLAVAGVGSVTGAPILGRALTATDDVRRGLQLSSTTATMPRRDAPAVQGASVHHEHRRDRRVIAEPYRQAFGRARTQEYGRPVGWMLGMAAVEKVFFPTALLIMAILRNWEGLALTVCLETLVGMALLAIASKGQRLEYMAKGLVVAPLRYTLLFSELITLGRFAGDMWFTKNRNWRK